MPHPRRKCLPFKEQTFGVFYTIFAFLVKHIKKKEVTPAPLHPTPHGGQHMNSRMSEDQSLGSQGKHRRDCSSVPATDFCRCSTPSQIKHGWAESSRELEDTQGACFVVLMRLLEELSISRGRYSTDEPKDIESFS